MFHSEGALDSCSDDQTTFSSWKFFRTLSFYFRPHQKGVALVVLACSLETGFYWVVPLAFRYLIDNTLATKDRNGLILVLVVLCAGAAVASVSSLWRGRYWAGVESQILSDIRFRLFHQLQRLSVSSYARTSTGKLLSHFSNDLSAVGNALTMSIAWGVLPGLDCFLGTIILFVLDYRLACLAALVWPWCLLIPPRLAARAASTESERKQREAEVLEVVQEQIATQTVIRAYGLAQLRIVNFFKTDARLFEAGVRANTGELGTRLSGGERQRIALARALVRRPRMLVLDEATSALDPQTAGEIGITLRKAALGRTMISVTHHLASITHCDHIFVMNRGRLAEHGTHEQLVAAGGVYSTLWRSTQDGRRLDSAIRTV
jgi:ABC-type multidrug transport system fused ATPase/permease subunit